MKKPINSESYAYLKSLIDGKNEIVDLYVVNKWLCAVLSSGCKLKVLN